MGTNLGFVDVSLLDPEAGEIIDLLLNNGISLPKHNLHCTLMYDKREIETPLAQLRPKEIFKAHVTSLEILGDGMVFHLTSRELSDEHRRLKDAGYIHSFNAFLPHMSITYDFSKYDILKCQQVFANWGGRELRFSNQSFGTN